MTAASLEERVQAIETQLAEFMRMHQAKPSGHAWRSVVGMFRDDPPIEELHRERLKTAPKGARKE